LSGNPGHQRGQTANHRLRRIRNPAASVLSDNHRVGVYFLHGRTGQQMQDEQTRPAGSPAFLLRGHGPHPLVLAGRVLLSCHCSLHHSWSVAVYAADRNGPDGRRLPQFHAVHHDGHPRQSLLRLVSDQRCAGRGRLHLRRS